MKRLIYVSRALVPARSAEAAVIYLDARRNNARTGITGYLHREGDVFAQFIEGGDDHIDRLVTRIRKDWRHRDIRVRHEERTERRQFGEWNMAFTEDEMNSFAGNRPGTARLRTLEDSSGEELIDFFTGSVSLIARAGYGASDPARDDRPRP